MRALKINGIVINELIIDSHVDKYSDHISDELIMNLVNCLSNRCFVPEESNGAFEYFDSNVSFKSDYYRLVWLTEEVSTYIGIVTAFKDKRSKYGTS